MKVTSEQIENRQVKLNIEMEKNEVDKYVQRAYQSLVNRVAVPGFRKGKTPRDIFENLIGKEVILQEAIEKMAPEAYNQAVEQENIIAIARPQIEVLQVDPIMFKAIVPIQPAVTVGNYKDIRIGYVIPEVELKDIEAAMQQIQYQQSSLVPVERTAEMGDIITMDISGEENRQTLPLRKDLAFELNSNSLPLPGFAEKIVGMNKGEEKSFILKYSEDFEMKELANREYSFSVKVNEIKKRELPEMDDELAKTMGNENLAELKEQVSIQLKKRNEQRAELDFENQLLDKLIEISKIEYSPVLSNAEVEAMLEEESRNFPDGIKGLDKYLNSMSKSLDEHKKEIFPIAEKRVMRSLVLNEIVKLEEINTNNDEVNEEIEEMIAQSPNEAENIKKLFSIEQTRKSLESILIRRKTFDRLKVITKAK